MKMTVLSSELSTDNTYDAAILCATLTFWASLIWKWHIVFNGVYSDDIQARLVHTADICQDCKMRGRRAADVFFAVGYFYVHVSL